jgi:mono/diheme cytochrome c family protein
MVIFTMIKILFLSFFLLSCEDSAQVKKGVTFVSGKQVSADTLNLGKQVYLEYCMACHGREGDGNGPAAKGSVPPPRNFKQGIYKFALVKDSGLPTDEDFKRIIQGGLKGTGMFPWDISDGQTYAVTQYIKTFAPQVWIKGQEVPGEKIEVSKDPYGLARKEFAINKGKEVYHMVANCQSCHRAYIPKQELSNLNIKYNDEELTEFDEDLYQLKLQESEYYFYDSEDRLTKFLPPDFTWHEIRSATTVKEIYERLVAGVTGSGMPAWRGTIEDEEIWAVSYYVRSLMDIKERGHRKDFIAQLKARNAAFKTVKNIEKAKKNQATSK